MNRIVEEAGRSLAPLRGVRPADDRSHDVRTAPHRAHDTQSGAPSAQFIDDTVELLGKGGGRGRPVISVPSSAFFAQHLGQHPAERRPDPAEQAGAAYRTAADLGVIFDRPAPLSLAV